MSIPEVCDVCLLLRNVLRPGPHRVVSWHLCDDHEEEYRDAQTRPLRSIR